MFVSWWHASRIVGIHDANHALCSTKWKNFGVRNR